MLVHLRVQPAAFALRLRPAAAAHALVVATAALRFVKGCPAALLRIGAAAQRRVGSLLLLALHPVLDIAIASGAAAAARGLVVAFARAAAYLTPTVLIALICHVAAP